MTYVVKTGQEVVDHIIHLRDSARNEPQTKSAGIRAAAFDTVRCFLEDLVIGEVKLTDLSSVTYKEQPSDYYDRMLIEHRELKNKLNGLSNFITNQPLFRTLPHEEQALQIAQHSHMAGYKATLELRIEMARQRIASLTLKDPVAGKYVRVEDEPKLL